MKFCSNYLRKTTRIRVMIWNDRIRQVEKIALARNTFESKVSRVGGISRTNKPDKRPELADSPDGHLIVSLNIQ